MSDLTEFFLNNDAGVAELELLEISHSSFSATHYIVRNALDGVTVTHEDATSHDYIYCPMRLSLSGPREDLDYTLRVDLGDLGELLTSEVDAVIGDDALDELPVVKYRAYRSDDLSAPLYGPVLMTVKGLAQTQEGFSFEAKAPSLNANKTGERYAIARFPMLAGTL